jgi:hypothetical protein
VGALTAGVAACGGSSGGAPKAKSASAPRSVSASALLARSRAVVDATGALHFALSSTGIPSSGTNIVGGSGDLVRPADLSGSFTVALSGVQASVKVVAIGPAFYAELPFTSSFAKVNPASLGLGNPAQLLSPATGVSALLTDAARGARRTGSIRRAGELLDEVTGTVPGDKIPVLPDADRAKPVRLVASIDPSNYQLRQVSLSGPFTSATTTTVYTVTLTDYGEHVSVAAPST